MESGFKVYINKQPWSCATGLYLTERRNGKTYVGIPQPPIVMAEVDEAQPLTQGPTLVFDDIWAEAIFKAIADALDEKGIKTDNDHKLQGTIEALRAHLADLRKLLKLEKRNAL